MKFCIADIVSATGGKLISGDLNAVVKNISTDTREIEQGSLFVALCGERFDGHNFIVNAERLGAIGCLVEKDISKEEFEQIDSVDFAIIKVESTLKSLAQIAASYRRMFDGRVCAITGSVGKTSSKDMVASVLSKGFSVHKTSGNYNNEIGMPLTVLGLREGHTALVVEMGMRGLGEIDYLAACAKPDIGVITNIGVSHIERLGSRENILKAKMEIAPHIKQGGYLVLNGDDDLLNEIDEYENITVMKFGINNKDADVYGDNIVVSGDGVHTEFELHIKSMPCEIYNVKLNVPGRHNVYNALSAVCVGIIFQMTMSDIIDGVAEYTPSEMRQALSVADGGFKIINDAYNASPDSMKAALDTLGEMKCEGKKIAVLGDMAELGAESERYHYEVGEHLKNANINVLITIGTQAKFIAAGAQEISGLQVMSFDTQKDAQDYIINIIEANDIILLKASRVMKLENLALTLQEK